MARMILQKYGTVHIQSEYQNTLSIGSGITVWARYNKDDEFHSVLGGDAIGERGKKAEDVDASYIEKVRSSKKELKKVIYSVKTHGLRDSYQEVMNKLITPSPLCTSIYR